MTAVRSRARWAGQGNRPFRCPSAHGSDGNHVPTSCPSESSGPRFPFAV